jgi:hypothetical protein
MARTNDVDFLVEKLKQMDGIVLAPALFDRDKEVRSRFKDKNSLSQALAGASSTKHPKIGRVPAKSEKYPNAKFGYALASPQPDKKVVPKRKKRSGIPDKTAPMPNRLKEKREPLVLEVGGYRVLVTPIEGVE